MPRHFLPSAGRRTPFLMALAGWGLVVAIGSTLTAQPVAAEEIKSAEEIIRALSGQGADETKESTPRVRGIQPRPRSSDPKPESRIDLTVHFATDSAAIEPRSQVQVQEIARAAGQLDLSSHARLLIIGHSDTRGPERYNQALSLRRAQAVKDSLVIEHGLAGDYLVAEGRGESEPLIHPELSRADYAKNRRVELRLVREPESIE